MQGMYVSLKKKKKIKKDKSSAGTRSRLQFPPICLFSPTLES